MGSTSVEMNEILGTMQKHFIKALKKKRKEATRLKTFYETLQRSLLFK